jgi:hypothetical protein
MKRLLSFWFFTDIVLLFVNNLDAQQIFNLVSEKNTVSSLAQDQQRGNLFFQKLIRY